MLKIRVALLLGFSLILTLSIGVSSASGKKTEGGTGLSFGKDHAYLLTAPPGWILDTETGAGQGIFTVFYPKGSSWNGAIAMYSNAATREGTSPGEAINHDVEAMRRNNPTLCVEDCDGSGYSAGVEPRSFAASLSDFF